MSFNTKGIGSVTKLLTGLSKRQKDDDVVDRLNSFYTVWVLSVFNIAILFLYNFKPVTCWGPKHMTGNHIKYMNNICWVQNTYYLPFEEEIPKKDEEGRRFLVYYQWIPFILLVQAILFYLPSTVWHTFNDRAGIDSDDILKAAGKFENCDDHSKRESKKKQLVTMIDYFVTSRKRFTKQFRQDYKDVVYCSVCSCFDFLGRRFGNYLIFIYIITKFLYLANIVFQLVILNQFLGFNFTTFGFDIVKYIAKGEDWEDAEFVAFPRITMCDFETRRLGNVHRYTVQCVMPFNMLLEKIFFFQWFWLAGLAVITSFSLFSWLMKVFSPSSQIYFVRSHLGVEEFHHNNNRKQQLKRFIGDYMRQDGIFIMRLINHNTNKLVAMEVFEGLWRKFLDRIQDEDDSVEMKSLANTSKDDIVKNKKEFD